MAASARAAAHTAGFAAEDSAAQMRAAVVTTETALAAALGGRDMLFDSERCRRVLIVCAVDRVALVAIAFGVFDVRFVREERAVRAACVIRRKRLHV